MERSLAHETRLVATVRRMTLMEASKARFKGTINILSEPATANLPAVVFEYADTK